MNNKLKHFAILGLVLVAIGIAWNLHAQNAPDARSTQVQLNQGLYPLIPISATAAVNNAAVLTIAAPPGGQYIYVCSLAFNASQDATQTANTNATTSSANFNSFALKFSLAATNSLAYDWSANWGAPGTGCVKSAAAGTLTSFTSPSNTHTAYSWEATYYIAP